MIAELIAAYFEYFSSNLFHMDIYILTGNIKISSLVNDQRTGLIFVRKEHGSSFNLLSIYRLFEML